jgi:ketosteroid isomerase-like protein
VAPTDNRERIDSFFSALNAGRFDDIAELMDPDVVQEWPQSGERIRGVKNFRAVMENYPGLPGVEPRRVVGAEDKWVLTPSWTPLRITGTGDVYTVETRIAYPNGEVWSGVTILQFRNGKASRLTEYFAAPFPPADWRSQWVEKMDTSTQL